MIRILSLLIFFFTLSAAPLNAKEPLQRDPHAVFPVEELTIISGSGEFQLTAEIADDARERTIGLMRRETMLPTHGMLFDFGREETITMWMENTPMSLDMVFIRSDGKITRIARNTKPYSRDIITSGGPVSNVLELKAGIALQMGLKPGDLVRHRFFKNNN